MQIVLRAYLAKFVFYRHMLQRNRTTQGKRLSDGICMDDYYCCYIDITVNLKICKLCLAPGYDFDYKMVSHKDAGNICEYCGRVPFTPVITLPLT